MERKEIRKSQGGFTLIEIIAVIVLLGVLAAVIVPQFNDITDEARDASARQAVAEGIARANARIAATIATNGGLDNIATTVAGISLAAEETSGEYTIEYTALAAAANNLCDGEPGITVTAYITEGNDAAPANAPSGVACFPVGTAGD